MLQKLSNLLLKAQTSKFWLFFLNHFLFRLIPFNKPHQLKIKSISQNACEISLPYRRSNLNHIRGTHACALAAAAEFSTGILLLHRLSPVKYRLIMQSLRMRYHYQAKQNASARCVIEEPWLQEKVIKALETEEKVQVQVVSEIYDTEGRHLCTGEIEWQIKAWSKVKSK